MADHRHILLIDDEATFRESTAALLREKGYTCDEAENADAALECMQQTEYGVVVADIRMPGNAKLEFVRKLAEVSPSLPVILVTGYPSVTTAMESVNLNVVGYLIKPIEIVDLLEHVNRALRRVDIRRLVRNIRQREQQRIQALSQIEQSMEDISIPLNEGVLQPIFDLVFQSVAYSYVDLKQLLDLLSRGREEELAVSLRNDPEKRKLIETMKEAIEVLEQTKQSFKSKQLASLRRRLESTLETMNHAAERGG